MRLPRLLAFSAFAFLVGQAANATTYFDAITGITPLTADTSTVMAASFTAATPDFTTVQLLLSVGDSTDGGSANVYIVADNGDGSGTGVAGTPNLTVLDPSTQIGSILDSSLTTGSQSLVTLLLSTSLSAPNQEYWIVLAKDASSSIQWYFNADNTGIGTAGQAIYFDATTLPLDGSTGSYQMIVATPEPAALAILGAGLAALGFVRRRTAA